MVCKTLARKLEEDSEFDDVPPLKIKSFQMPTHVLKKFRKWKKIGAIQSISDAIRICIYFGYHKFEQEILKGARIPHMRDFRYTDGFPMNNNPDIIFVYQKNGTYKKYREVKNELEKIK